ncbi:unnamed protein product [Hydatigera taeniaeformis]|uniref:Synapsin_C domain-containing protein n=1 Tax=Hydatigena taeniaeformis TaxID=6205 RepID=A0A0R3XB76_HYDTA|nr:unnamed protein product [Hydatigera taeniaeformis]
MFGGLDMCSIKVLQDTAGEYFIQDWCTGQTPTKILDSGKKTVDCTQVVVRKVYGSDFILLGDGQEEDRMRIAELLLQRMEYAAKSATGPMSQPKVSQTSTKLIQASTPSAIGQVAPSMQSVVGTTTPTREQSMQPTFGQIRQQQQPPLSSVSNQEQQRLPKTQPPPPQPPPLSGPSSSQGYREPLSGRSNISGGAMDFGQSRGSLQSQTKTQSQFEPSIHQSQSSRNEFSTQEAFDKPKTSMRTTSMDFSSRPPSKRTSYSREGDESMRMSSSSTHAAVSIPPSESRPSESWSSGNSGRPIREPSVESLESMRGRGQKEAAPQPPRQSSLINSFETRTFDSCGSGTASSNSATSTTIFDPSMNIFQPQVQSKSSISTFQSQSQERDTPTSMKFDTSPLDFGRSALGSQHNDPWSVPPPPPPSSSSVSVNQTSQLPSLLTTSSASSSSSSSGTTTTTTTTSMATRSRQTSQQSIGNADDADDTMKNLRKTFAGIFGDI